VLDVNGLCAGYGDVPILKGVSLSVPDGKLVVLTGPNGHGKTTLLRVLSGVLPSTAGNITFAGKDIRNHRPSDIVALGLVHVPQGDLLFQELSVEQNLYMGAYRRDAWKQRRSGVKQVFSLFPRLEERKGQQSRTLSGGERRMVALGRGLMAGARLLMVDEPALGLAPVLVEEVYSKLAQIVHDLGTTMLLVEESLANAESLADYVYVMEKGVVVAEGTVPEVRASGVLESAYLGTGALE
jgi:branched-chain amino acid transport system ATP-binding protein